MGNNTVQNVISKYQDVDPTNYEHIIKLHERLMNIKNRVYWAKEFAKGTKLSKTSSMNNPRKIYRTRGHILHIIIQYIRIRYNANPGVNGLIVFILGLGFSLLSVCIENAAGGFQYGFNPKIGGMLLNNVGIAIMALGAVLLGTAISKNIK